MATLVPQVITRRPRYNRHGSVGVVFEDIYGPRYVQPRPWIKPLPYQRHVRYLDVLVNDDNNWVCTLRSLPLGAGTAAMTYQRAYSKFVAQCLQSERAEVGMNLASAKMTSDLLRDSLFGLTRMEKIGELANQHDRFSRTLRKAVTSKRGRAQYWRNRAAQILGTAPTSQGEVDRILRSWGYRRGARLFAAEYLAFHYGWAPLIGDMFTILEQLQKGYTVNPVVIRSRSRVTTPYFHRPTAQSTLSGTGRYSVELGAVAQVSSEILFVMNRTGLINPATVVWDKVPFSFVADWFGNFSQQFAGPTDFVGVSLRDAYQTTFHDYKVTDSFTKSAAQPWDRLMVTTGVSMVRTTLPRPPVPSFYLKVPYGGSWRRALAQISLLTAFGAQRTPRR